MESELARLYGGRVTIVRNTRNGGYGQGNNIGIRHSSAPVIMIMNPDVRLIHLSLKEIVTRYEQDKNIAICGFKQVINQQGRRGTSFSLLNHYHGLIRLAGGIVANRLNCFCWRHMYFSGSCFCIRKDIFEQAGLFDEHLFLYGEENDIHYRIHHACPEARDIYLKDSVYLHLTENRPTTDKQFAQRVASNEYVMQQQGRPKGTYIRSEEQRQKWAKQLFGNA